MSLTIYTASGLQKAQSSTVYDTDQIGTVKAYAGATVPTNWMLCDGRTLPRTSYPALFDALGGTASPWGLPDGTSFSLPDLRSRMIVGTGAGVGLTTRSMNGKGGEERHLLTTAEAAQKAVTSGDDSPDHAHTVYGTRLTVASSGAFILRTKIEGNYDTSGSEATTGASVRHQHAIAGSNAANDHENMPPWVAVAWIIKVLGVSIDTSGGLVVSSNVATMDTWHAVNPIGGADPAFVNSWVNRDISRTVRFMKDPLGRVMLTGHAKSGVNDSAVFQMPLGYRPTRIDQVFNCIASGGDAQVTIASSDGYVSAKGLSGNAVTWVSFDGIIFDTETVTQMPTGPQGPKGDVGGNATVPMEAWQNINPIGGATPAFINGWQVLAGYGPVGFRKDPFGRVRLRGSIYNGTSGSVAFQLPDGYRPAVVARTVAIGNQTATGQWEAQVNVGTDGNVLIYYTGPQASSYVGLDLIEIDTGTVTAMPTGPQGPTGPAGGVTGDVKMTAIPIVAGTSEPPGWLLCNGQAVSRVTYAALFNAIGTAYGVGDGSTTFNLPDLRGAAPIGAGTGTYAGATAHALGSMGGEEKHTLLMAEAAQKNTVVTGVMSANASHNHTTAGNGLTLGTGTAYTSAANIPTTGSSYGGTSSPVNAANTDHTHTITGSDATTAHNNYQPYVTINYIIKT